MLHLNDVKILQENDLKYFNQSKIGDYLLSLHTLNAIVLIDHETLKIKWYLRDKMKRQHSPNITEDGYLIIFDNKGSDEKYGKSRIIKYDLKNNEFDSYFDGNDDFYFESSIREGFSYLIIKFLLLVHSRVKYLDWIVKQQI